MPPRPQNKHNNRVDFIYRAAAELLMTLGAISVSEEAGRKEGPKRKIMRKKLNLRRAGRD